MYELVINAVGLYLDSDTNVFTVVFAEREDGDGRSLEIQRALNFDEQDRALGQATYCLCLDRSTTHYGDIDTCILRDAVLTITLRGGAVRVFETKAFRLILRVAVEAIRDLEGGLRRVFTDVPHPPRLIVSMTPEEPRPGG
jgi:hypothetical protein